MYALDTSLGGRNDSFPSTRWSEVLAAGSDGPDRRTRLDALLRKCWRPVYAFVRAWGRYHPEDAKDLTQAFFTHFLEKRYLSSLDPGRGRFRGYLLQSLRHFLIDARRSQRAICRGGGSYDLFDASHEELEDLGAVAPTEPPERVFEREWIHSLLQASLDDLRDELALKRKSWWFEAMRHYCLEEVASTYAQVAAQLGRSETEVRHALERARAILRGIVRRRIRDYAAGDDEVEEELREVFGE